MVRPTPSSSCAPCMVLSWIAAILLFMVTFLSLVGVYKAHLVTGGMRFGTGDGALYIIAFCVSLGLWTKQMTVCCGCGSKR